MSMLKQAFNPYLPSWEYIPDGEPHVFGDLRAGVNMDMMSAAYLFHAAELVREGRIPESLIDSLCCEVLAVKFRLGLDYDHRCGSPYG